MSQVIGRFIAELILPPKLSIDYLIWNLSNEDNSEDISFGYSLVVNIFNVVENSKSDWFINYLPGLILPILKNASKELWFSSLLSWLLKLLPLCKQLEENELNSEGFKFLKILNQQQVSNSDEFLSDLKLSTHNIHLRDY